MKKKHKLAVLKEQREQLDKQIEKIESELEVENKWADGHWFIHPASFPSFFMIKPELTEIEMGVIFTTETNCQAYIDYQKAMVKLRDACRPYRPVGEEYAYVPCLNHADQPDFHSWLIATPKIFWVGTSLQALKIAQAHIEDLKIIRDFTWEI
jgi:hypothetical protein